MRLHCSACGNLRGSLFTRLASADISGRSLGVSGGDHTGFGSLLGGAALGLFWLLALLHKGKRRRGSTMSRAQA